MYGTDMSLVEFVQQNQYHAENVTGFYRTHNSCLSHSQSRHGITSS